MWLWVPRDSELRMTALERTSSNCKRQTHPLLRGCYIRIITASVQLEKNCWSWVSRGLALGRTYWRYTASRKVTLTLTLTLTLTEGALGRPSPFTSPACADGNGAVQMGSAFRAGWMRGTEDCLQSQSDRTWTVHSEFGAVLQTRPVPRSGPSTLLSYATAKRKHSGYFLFLPDVLRSISDEEWHRHFQLFRQLDIPGLMSLSVLRFHTAVRGYCVHSLAQLSETLPTQCPWVFRVNTTLNSDCFAKQH
jgi:hypothetical protein